MHFGVRRFNAAFHLAKVESSTSKQISRIDYSYCARRQLKPRLLVHLPRIPLLAIIPIASQVLWWHECCTS
jgi:hypothetical protein